VPVSVRVCPKPKKRSAMYWNMPGVTADAGTPAADAPIVVWPTGKPLMSSTPLFVSVGA